MAIDTAEKRRSAGGVHYLPLGPGVTPNVSKDSEWRQQAGWGYSGIPAASPSVATYPTIFLTGGAYRSIQTLGGAQRNINLLGSAGSN